MKKILTFIVIVAMSSSCSLKLREAEVETPTKYIFEDGVNANNQTINSKWWESFDDPALNSLEMSALENNRDLAAAMANVEASRHYLRVAKAEFLPSLSFEGIAEVIHEEQTTTQEYTLAPTIEWEISLFGELRNTKRAAAAALLQEEWNFRAVWLSLTAEVATSYFTLLQYERSREIATQSYELRKIATALVDSMYRYGMSNGTDLMQAKSLVYAAKAEMQKYERAVALASLSLDVLLGENPQAVDWQGTGEALLSDKLPIAIPIGLPSTLLERRPDIMKSYFAMAEAAAKVGVSRAERYPSISLTADGGVFATSLKDLTSGNPLLWSATAEIIAPIFSWGKLRRKELIARESYAASIESYEQSIIEAFSDVESSLVTISTYNQQSATTAALVGANSKIAQNSNALYKSGLGDYLSVIDAERELYSSQISLVELITQQYINYVDLFKALGGGW